MGSAACAMNNPRSGWGYGFASCAQSHRVNTRATSTMNTAEDVFSRALPGLHEPIPSRLLGLCDGIRPDAARLAPPVDLLHDDGRLCGKVGGVEVRGGMEAAAKACKVLVAGARVCVCGGGLLGVALRSSRASSGGSVSEVPHACPSLSFLGA